LRVAAKIGRFREFVFRRFCVISWIVCLLSKDTLDEIPRIEKQKLHEERLHVVEKS